MITANRNFSPNSWTYCAPLPDEYIILKSEIMTLGELCLNSANKWFSIEVWIWESDSKTKLHDLFVNWLDGCCATCRQEVWQTYLWSLSPVPGLSSCQSTDRWWWDRQRTTDRHRHLRQTQRTYVVRPPALKYSQFNRLGDLSVQVNSGCSRRLRGSQFKTLTMNRN